MNEFLGLSIATTYIACIVIGALNILWAIVSAILASQKGRSAVSWFFLGGFYGFIGFLCLLLAGPLQSGEKDSISKILWILVILPILLLLFLAYLAFSCI